MTDNIINIRLIGNSIGSFYEDLLVKYQNNTYQFSWINPSKDIDKSWLVYGGTESQYPGRCIEEFLELHGKVITTAINKKPLQEFRVVAHALPPSEIPWRYALPKIDYATYIKSLIEEILGCLFPIWNNLEGEYYRTTYSQTTKACGYFQPAKINVSYFSEQKNNFNNSLTSVFDSFKPNEEGFSRAPTYSKSKSRTGRLITTSGANMLLLEKKHRSKILESRFGKDGQIIQLDYKSLEPRVLLGYLNKKEEAAQLDIYADTAKKFSLTIPRGTVKDIVLSKLYGAGKEKILSLLGENPEYVMNCINEHFSFREMTNMLQAQHDESGRKMIRNAYGRCIKTDDVQSRVFLNYFCQSSAVDVALLGFHQILLYLEKYQLLSLIVPIFFLHDAVLLDVHKDAMPEISFLKIIGSQNIMKFEDIQFYLEDSNVT